ncbi:MAG: PPC domain-containing DNA-binding protein [Methanomicrobiales archaeon]
MIASRLGPGQDLKLELVKIVKTRQLESGVIISIVGSLNNAILRMADGNTKIFNGPFEIVSAEGTLSKDGVHVHVAIADENGLVSGGHLKNGCEVNTTVELCILRTKHSFSRVFDPKTGYKELIVDEKNEFF